MTSTALAHVVKHRFTAWLGFGLGAFHLATVAGLLVVSTMVVRAVHLTAVLVLIYLTYASATDETTGLRKRLGPYLDVSFGFLAFVTGAYLLVRWNEIALSGGLTTTLDLIVGSMIILLVLEAARRAGKPAKETEA